MKMKAVFILVLFAFSMVNSSGNLGVQTPKLDAVKLVIGTRHDSVLYNAFAEEFVKSQFAADVGITSVSEISFFTPTTYDGFKKVLTNEAVGGDIGWGGGPTLFTSLSADGAVAPITDPATLAAINEAVPDKIAGADMKAYDTSGDLIWAANAISSFGFTVNNKVLKERGLEKPTTWEDLASPDFFTTQAEFNIGMGNAPDTTSNTRIYQIILQKFGWEKGWEIIYQMAGNAKVYGGSVETRASVISGETAVAMTIDFYGIIAQSENPDTEYIVPENGSIVNGDPIVLSSKAPHVAAANAFIQFAFSQEAQAIWMRKGINRLPVREDAFQTETGKSRPDIYAMYNATLVNKGIDFSEDLALSLEEPMRFHWQETITNVHTRHRSAWATMVNALNTGNITQAKFDELRSKFVKPAMTQKEAQDMNADFNADQAVRRAKQDEWFESASKKLDDLDQDFYSLGLKVPPEEEKSPLPIVPFIAALFFISAVVMLRRRRN